MLESGLPASAATLLVLATTISAPTARISATTTVAALTSTISTTLATTVTSFTTSTVSTTSVATAAARVIATTAATATTESTATTARAALRSLVNTDSATIKFDVVHGIDSLLCVSLGAIANETKTAAAASITVLDNDSLLDGAEFLEFLTERILISVPCEAANEELRHLRNYLEKLVFLGVVSGWVRKIERGRDAKQFGRTTERTVLFGAVFVAIWVGGLSEG